ncbi:MAG TPA: phage portal protein, partial [Pirellulales bacterium]
MTCKLTEEQTAAIDRAITVRSWTPENSFGGMYAQGDAPAGVAVTEQNALTYSAVFRAVVLIGEIVGRMPMNVYRFTGLDDDSRERARRHPAEYLLNKKANRRVDAARLRETMTMLALTWGHAEAEIVRNGAGVPTELHLLPPWATKLDCTNGDLFFYRVRAARGGE